MNLFTFQPSNRLKGQLDAALSPAASTPLIYSSLIEKSTKVIKKLKLEK